MKYKKPLDVIILKIVVWSLLMALIYCLCSCESTSHAPDPVEVLKDQVETERGLRSKAESTADKEAQLRRKCELTIAIVSILAVVGFISGTIVGSRGRRHADER